jgi:6,7-dimethyl-8-ribityllumazine synthase
MNCKETSGQLNAKGLKFGIVVSRFNDLFTGQLLKGAVDCLPATARMKRTSRSSGCPAPMSSPSPSRSWPRPASTTPSSRLGTVIQGATSHAALINAQVARALTQISLESGVPVIDGIVAAENLDQAIERCGSKSGNRGWNAAQTAIEMASLLQQLP